MAKATSYNSSGVREDLTSVISTLEPEATPFISMMKKAKATGTFVEWQCDKLRTPSFDGVSEGLDVQSFTNQSEDRARLGNYVQKFRETYMVSDIQQLVDVAGVQTAVSCEVLEKIHSVRLPLRFTNAMK